MTVYFFLRRKTSVRAAASTAFAAQARGGAPRAVAAHFAGAPLPHGAARPPRGRRGWPRRPFPARRGRLLCGAGRELPPPDPRPRLRASPLYASPLRASPLYASPSAPLHFMHPPAVPARARAAGPEVGGGGSDGARFGSFRRRSRCSRSSSRLQTKASCRRTWVSTALGRAWSTSGRLGGGWPPGDVGDAGGRRGTWGTQAARHSRTHASLREARRHGELRRGGS